ncbi:hypothetical protein CFP65_5924 [Kitasatospora sp. MMS16-BH015]|uniref:hypothetical protein n=1 Tax=Kitasatospora sp. MMS16-BH015 TaxID=2018025 RepID=UPI000CA2CD52|nr:hypothetical protein [Kitasatospora sp. MMS16-BH015]AUG80601.1 hypothetical protein CFP65_5924 [Kitasatospora sp. MMS16-BH015]
MTVLMTSVGPVGAESLLTRTGGVPLVPAGFVWPRCAGCGGAMQFLAQVVLDDLGRNGLSGAAVGRGVLAVFMCQNEPGQCGDWSAGSGGNSALVLPSAGLRLAEVPGQGALLLGAVTGVTYMQAGTGGYDDDAEVWYRTAGRAAREVMGQLGGEPEWLQGDQTPGCAGCGGEMGFVAQFEEGPDARTAANFGGGGAAYAFACEPCGEAAFLWQC